MRFSLASVALVHRVEGGPAIAAHSPGPETHCVYERIASRRQANRITEAESHEGAHGNRITESQILRFGSTKGLKSQILVTDVALAVTAVHRTALTSVRAVTIDPS